jgi:hypothetical protein
MKFEPGQPSKTQLETTSPQPPRRGGASELVPPKKESQLFLRSYHKSTQAAEKLDERVAVMKNEDSEFALMIGVSVCP